MLSIWMAKRNGTTLDNEKKLNKIIMQTNLNSTVRLCFVVAETSINILLFESARLAANTDLVLDAMLCTKRFSPSVSMFGLHVRFFYWIDISLLPDTKYIHMVCHFHTINS